MKPTVKAMVLLVGVIIGLIACLGSPLQAAEPNASDAPKVGKELKVGEWTGGGAVGFLGNTPDGTAFATNLNADYFVTHQLSVGPLAQIAATGDLFQIGFSGQMKVWLDLPESDRRLKLNVQGGLGFLHADLHTSDTSWLIPLGVGLDYALNPHLRLTATFLLNFTDVETGRGTGADVMPGLTFGVRF